MPLEPKFDYLDDLDPNNPADNDPVSQGDDHIRGDKAATLANITGDNTETRLKVAGKATVLARTDAVEIVGGLTGSYVRLRNDDDSAGRAQIAALVSGGLFIDSQIDGEPVAIRARTADGLSDNAVFDGLGDTGGRVLWQGSNRLAASSLGADAVGTVFQLLSGASSGRIVAQGDAGGVAIRHSGSLQRAWLEQRDATGENAHKMIAYDRTTGIVDIHWGDLVVGYSSPQGINAKPSPGLGANVGGRLGIDGEGTNKAGSIDNFAGVIRILTNDDAHEALTATPGAQTRLNDARGNGYIETTNSGGRMGDLGTGFFVDVVSGSQISFSRDGPNYLDIAGSSAQFRVRHDGTALLYIYPFAATEFFYNKQRAMGTRDTGANSRGYVYDDDDIAQPVGFNGVPRTDMSGTTYNIPTDGSANGRRYRRSSSSTTSCVLANGVVGANQSFKIYNNVSTSKLTITIPSGITGRWYSGGGVVERAGPSSFDLAEGGAMWVTGFSASIFELDGPLS